MRLHLDVDGLEFLHQGLVDVQTAGGIEDDDVAAVFLRELNCVAADLDGVFVFTLGVDGRVSLLAEGVQLIDGGGTLQIGGDEEGIFALGFEVLGEFPAGSGFAGALEATEHDDGRRGGDEEAAGGGGAGIAVFVEDDIFSHQLNESVVDNLDHLLAGLDGRENFGADGFLGDFGDEGVDDIEVDIGFEEGGADFLHGVAHVGFGDFSFAGEVAKEGAETFLEGVEHGNLTSSVKGLLKQLGVL